MLKVPPNHQMQSCDRATVPQHSQCEQSWQMLPLWLAGLTLTLTGLRESLFFSFTVLTLSAHIHVVAGCDYESCGVWKASCLKDDPSSLQNGTSAKPSIIPKHHSDALDMIMDLCAAAGRECKLCPLNWVSFSGKCYLFSEERNNWSSGREDCQRRKADIISIEESEEKDFISKQVSSKNGHFWVGLRKHESQWKWETGENFFKSISVTSNEHRCATFGRDMSAESCNNPNKWICEKKMTRYLL
ncbi:CD209 antigen-like protein A [Gastrophryne carolinensis]